MENLIAVRPLDIIETEINFYKQQTATGIIEIGKRLIEAKSQLEHGQWGTWLEDKVDFTPQSARKFMRVAEEFGNGNLSFGLGTKKLWLLLDVPQDQREDFIEQNDVENITTRQLQEEIRKLKEQSKVEVEELIKEKEDEIHGIYIDKVKELENKPAKIIDNTDYSTINKLKSDVTTKQADIDKLKRDKDLLERKVKLNESEAQKFGELKKQIEFLSKEKEDISRQIASATELSGLAIKIDNMLKTELSPIRYSRTLERLDSDIAVKNLEDIIDSVQSWCDDMRNTLNKNINIVEVSINE